VLERVPGAVGYIQPGVTVQAVDGSDQVLPPLQDGVLRVRNSHMVSGYLGDPETTKAVFRDGYFYSGDVGHVTPEGILVITGRAKTALNIGGDTVSPEFVEDVVAGCPGVQECAVFAANNDLGIAELTLLVVASSPINGAAVQRYCASRLPPSCAPARVFQVDALPRGGQGKLDRKRLPDIVAALGKAS
jgi:acyl-CoA synthetase (AMP-forming)/AMP-acid ligase II